MPGRLRTRRSTTAALIVLACLLIPQVGVAHAQAPFASYVTPGCDSAPIWRMGYRMYFRDADGRTLARGTELDEALAEARRFVDRVGRFSHCGVRIALDVFDMGDATWGRGTPEYGEAYPDDTESFRESRGYDAVLYRHPYAQGAGASVHPSTLRDAEFGEVDMPSFPVGSPWANLLMHEWLHIVVFFYDQVRWPSNDVHGGCDRPEYAQSETEGCMVRSRWFAHLMTACVHENGQRFGIARNHWAFYGTPRAPLNQGAAPPPGEAVSCEFDESQTEPALRRPRVRIASVRVRGRTVTARLRTERAARGSLRVDLRQPRRLVRLRRVRRSGGTWTFRGRATRAGRWVVVADFRGRNGWDDQVSGTRRVRIR